MASRKTRDVESALERKGFKKESSHHRYFIFHNSQGKKTSVSTYTSNGSKELDDYLIGQMAKQCCLTKKKFLDLIDCPLSQEDYEKSLVEGEHISG